MFVWVSVRVAPQASGWRALGESRKRPRTCEKNELRVSSGADRVVVLDKC